MKTDKGVTDVKTDNLIPINFEKIRIGDNTYSPHDRIMIYVNDTPPLSVSINTIVEILNKESVNWGKAIDNR